MGRFFIERWGEQTASKPVGFVCVGRESYVREEVDKRPLLSITVVTVVRKY
jgi:hypothetical protein